jgi:hypothetical protein
VTYNPAHHVLLYFSILINHRRLLHFVTLPITHFSVLYYLILGSDILVHTLFSYTLRLRFYLNVNNFYICIKQRAKWLSVFLTDTSPLCKCI